MSGTGLFSTVEEERYARHFSLPGVGKAGQEKLKSARVLIVGAGGLGCPAALYLAAAGVGHLTLIDFDQVHLSNLQRQILFSTADEDEVKVQAAQKRLSGLNPEIEVVGLHKKLTAENARTVVANFDLVLDGSDNFKTRYVVNQACVAENKPVVFGAVSRFDAQVSVFNFEGGPCYRCLFSDPPGVEATANCQEAGVLGVLPGTIGTLMATEALKILLGLGKPLRAELLTYDALNAEFSKRGFSRRAECETCGTNRFTSLAEFSANFGEDTSVHSADHSLSWTEFSLGAHKGVVIDVRSPEEFAKESIAGSRNIPLAALSLQFSSGDFDTLDRTTPAMQTPLIFLCRSGVRSARAVELARAAGYEHARHVQGGLNERRAE